MLTARCGRLVLLGEARAGSRPRSSGVSPYATTTVPVVAPASASSATRTAWPVPSCVSWTASTASGTSSGMCGPTCSRWWPTTATIRVGLASPATAASTWPIMLRPPIGCSTFMVLDFIRVPPPAARTMTVRLLATEFLLDPRRCSPGRSRTYVASPDSKSGGPCRQTNRGYDSRVTLRGRGGCGGGRRARPGRLHPGSRRAPSRPLPRAVLRLRARAAGAGYGRALAATARVAGMDLPVMPPVQPMLAKPVKGIPDPEKFGGLSLRAEVGRVPVPGVQGRRRGRAGQSATPSR